MRCQVHHLVEKREQPPVRGIGRIDGDDRETGVMDRKAACDVHGNTAQLEHEYTSSLDCPSPQPEGAVPRGCLELGVEVDFQLAP